MFGFLAVLLVSVALVLLVQALDIECMNAPKSRKALTGKKPQQSGSMPYGTVLTGLR